MPSPISPDVARGYEGALKALCDVREHAREDETVARPTDEPNVPMHGDRW